MKIINRNLYTAGDAVGLLELYFCDANWPAFSKIDFLMAIRAYKGREARSGR